MSAPSRGAGAGRARSITPPTSRGRGSRGANRPFQPRGRGRGEAATTTNPRASGLLQGFQAGNLNKRGTDNGTVRGTRGRGTATRGSSTSSRGQFPNKSKTLNTAKPAAAAPEASRPISSTDYMAQATTRFETLKRNRESERARAIKNGFLADPEKKTTLDNAITPVGICTEMCPAFERVERIVQRMVDKSERALDDTTRPDEQRMVKRFRRSAAGYDEQLPSDIRTPATLKMTLDYLLDNIIGGGERLASVHKFVWDRTRGIRNDFSIQQVTKKEDVRLAVECLERIARFHILSLHQLSNPENIVGEQFDAHQDREQLNNTLLSLMYYYDDNRHVMDFPNEAEFRAYCIIFELQSQHPDLEDRMQSWPQALLEDGRVKTAFKLYATAGNNLFDQGPLRPMTTFSLAQGNTGSFWNILSSKQVSYLMACVAEIYFGQVRFMALQALWSAATSAPVGQRAKNQDWTLEELAHVLGFDADEQAAEFCEGFGLKISMKDDGTQYLDITLNETLDKSSIPNRQVFSFGIVEAKRFRRTLNAVINGKTVPQAVREGLVVADVDQPEQDDPADDGESLFIPEKKTFSANPFVQPAERATANPFAKAASVFSPQAPAVSPGTGMSQQPLSMAGRQTETSANTFAKAVNGFSASNQPAQSSANPFANATSAFLAATPPKVDSPTTAAKTANPFSKGNAFSITPQSSTNNNGFSFTPQSTPPKPTSQPFVFGGTAFTANPSVLSVNADPPPPTTSSFSLSGFTSQPTTSQQISTSHPVSQPPTFSFLPPQQENTRSTAAPGHDPQFFSANNNASHGPPMPQMSAPPGMITGQQTPQPRMKTPHQSAPLLSGVDSSGLPANGPPSSSHQPTISFPRQFPQTASPLVGRDPSHALAQHHNTIVLPSIESIAGWTPGAQNPLVNSTRQENKQPDDAPGGRAENPLEIDADADANSQGSLSPYYGYERRYQPPEPSVPFYRRYNPEPAPPKKPLKPPKPPKTAAQKEIERHHIVDAVAHIAMTSNDNDNIMDNLVRFLAPKIVDEAIQQHLKDVEEAQFKINHERYIEVKFGVAFLTKTRRMIRERHAGERREAFAQMERDAEEKARKSAKEEEERKRKEAEKEEIRREMASSERIKAEIAASLERERKGKKAKAAKANQVAGKKRKSDVSEDGEATAPRLDLAGRLYTPLPRHKRSRTETFLPSDESDQDSERDFRQSKIRPLHRYYPGRSMFSNKPSAHGPRLASEGYAPRSIDRTKTDYFRLKARGVDPDTPFIPLTAEQVEYKRQQDIEEKASRAAEPMPWKIANPLLYRLEKNRQALLPRPAPKNFEWPLPQKKADTFQPYPKRTITQKDSDSINDLLSKLKRARETQEEDTKWFKDQAEQMEQEVATVDQAVQVQHTIESRNSSPTNSSGLMRSQAGYEFVPLGPKPGQPLSRTEERIRRTGARGLASKPIGGTPGYVKPEMPYLERTLRAELHGQQEVEELSHVESKGKGRAVEEPNDWEEVAGGFQPPREDLEDEVDYYDEDDVESYEEDYEEEYDEEEEVEDDAGPSQYLEASSRGASQFSGAGASADDAIELDSD